MIVSTIDEGQIEQLRRTLAGRVLGPNDAGYEGARAVHNGLIDMRPAVIARCLSPADVIAALRFGRERAWRSPSAAAGTASPDCRPRTAES